MMYGINTDPIKLNLSARQLATVRMELRVSLMVFIFYLGDDWKKNDDKH